MTANDSDSDTYLSPAVCHQLSPAVVAALVAAVIAAVIAAVSHEHPRRTVCGATNERDRTLKI